MRSLAILPLAALLLTSACAYDYAGGYAPDYSSGYDDGQGSGWGAGWGNGQMAQPGDRFGGRNVANIAVFDTELAPYGRWVSSRFGRAFRPDVGPDWRPYVNGRWGENRLWFSNDPWGWATDHYGRWGFDDRSGWVWTPGNEWAPSWVAWREDEGQNVSGWAPIPPGVNYSINLGFGTGWGYDNFNSWYAPSWVWVPRSYLYQPGFGGRVLPWRSGANYWGGSRWQNQPAWGGRRGWQGHPGYGGDQFGNGQGNWQGNRQGHWQGNGPDNWQNRRGNESGNWQGRGGYPGGLRPGQSAVPDRDGFVGYRSAPRANPDDQQRGGGAMPPERAQPVTPAPTYTTPPPQYVERPAPPPVAQSEAPQREDSGRRSASNDEGPTRPQ